MRLRLHLEGASGRPYSARRVTDRLLMLLAVLGWSLAACGGSGTLSGSEYRDPEASYRIGQMPGGWERLDVEDANDLAWENPGLAAVIQVNASCDPDLDIPLAALRNHLLIGFTERRVQDEQLVPLDSREALRTHLVAKLDGVPREMILTILKKNGCVYDFALVAPPGSEFARARQDYDALVGGFHVGGGQ